MGIVLVLASGIVVTASFIRSTTVVPWWDLAMNIVVALLIMLASLAAIYASNRYEYARAALLVLFAVAMELMGLYLLYKSNSAALATVMTGEHNVITMQC